MAFKDKGIVFWAYVLVLKVHIVLELVLLFILVLVEVLLIPILMGLRIPKSMVVLILIPTIIVLIPILIVLL